MNTTSGTRTVLFGGTWYAKTIAGLSHYYMNSSFNSNSINVGARLIKTAM